MINGNEEQTWNSFITLSELFFQTLRSPAINTDKNYLKIFSDYLFYGSNFLKIASNIKSHDRLSELKSILLTWHINGYLGENCVNVLISHVGKVMRKEYKNTDRFKTLMDFNEVKDDLERAGRINFLNQYQHLD